MIVLDTHTLIWWVCGSDQLSAAAAQAIERERSQARRSESVLVSSISAWEIGMLVQRNRLSLSMSAGDWLATVEQINGLRFVPVDRHLALASVNLPGEFHKDPADRLIVATARHFGATLMTADDKILRYPHVRSLW